MPNLRIRELVIALIICHLVHPFILVAQQNTIQFKRLNTGHGLNDNLVNKAMTDRMGLLWIATSEGLNSYNGYSVKNWNIYIKDKLGSLNIRDLYCDTLNNVWVHSPEGKAGWLNGSRRLQLIELPERHKSKKVDYFLYHPQKGMIVLAGQFMFGHLYPKQKFDSIGALPNALYDGIITDMAINSGNGDAYLATPKGILALSGKSLHARMLKAMANITGLALVSPGKLMVASNNPAALQLIDANNGSVLEDFSLVTNQYSLGSQAYFRKMAMIDSINIGIGSSYGGYYVLNMHARTLTNYTFDPLNDKSIANNYPTAITSDLRGNVFIASREAGLSMYNAKSTGVYARRFFQDSKTGKITGGYYSHIVQDKEGYFLVGAEKGLLRWHPKKEDTRIISINDSEGQSLYGKANISALCFDTDGKLWVGTSTGGIIVLNKQLNAERYITQQQGQLASNAVTGLTLAPDGYMWVTTQKGLNIMHSKSLTNVSSQKMPLLETLSGHTIFSVWPRSASELWLGTDTGAFQIALPSYSIKKHITTQQGLRQNRVSYFGSDSSGNLYMCSRNGFYTLSNDNKLAFYGTANGLPNEICLGVETDANNQVWISNDNYLIRFSPERRTMKVFSSSSGISLGGFRLGHMQDEDGFLYWCCNDGITYFHPTEPGRNVQRPTAYIDQLSTAGIKRNFTKDAQITLPPGQNSLQFSLSTVDVFHSQPATLRYKLLGAEEDWHTISNLQNEIGYQNLAPGDYTLLVEINDGTNTWLPAENKVELRLLQHWYQKGWVQLLVLLLLSGFAGYFLDNLRKKKELQKEAAEIDKAVFYLSSAIHSHNNVDNLLWDVAKNVIANLSFEDCVIYLLDDEKGVLVQKAAWGPKNSQPNTIQNPIDIPLGKGIVGFVAQSGVAEIIYDTSLDERYIVDDQQRLSELAVPIVSEGKVLGVIDSEHTRKGFFTNRHVAILTTIASVLGSKIASIRAAEQRNAAEMALLENKQRISEVEMKALRAQMNPHFMFNSLNSINNFILKSDTENASEYLTRFARLMRLILDNSRNEWVTLENELKALRLYIEMESIRFDNVFEYSFELDPAIQATNTLLPPMLIQPYVENAIWHGLLHRTEPGSKLTIHVEKKDTELEIQIEDNGIGRTAAMALKSKFGTHKQSHGMKITAERLDTVNDVYHINARASINDIFGADGTVAGTRVTLTMKLTTHEDHYH